MSYFFNKLRSRARERGHEFTLTLEQYTKFAEETGYAKLKGKTAQCLSIDRIDNSKGYHVDNIRAVTLRDNSKLKYAPLPDFMRAEMESLEKRNAVSPV